MVANRLPGPTGVAQIGYLRRLFQDPQPALDELRDHYGEVCGLGFGPVRMAIVGEPALLKELFATSSESFRWGHKFNVLGFVVGPGSMIVSDGADHRRRRSSVQSALSRRRLNGWIPQIVSQTDAKRQQVGCRLQADRHHGSGDAEPRGAKIARVRELFGVHRLSPRNQLRTRAPNPVSPLQPNGCSIG